MEVVKIKIPTGLDVAGSAKHICECAYPTCIKEKFSVFEVYLHECVFRFCVDAKSNIVNFTVMYENGETVEGRTMRRIKGGLVVDLLGIDAFLPGSQIDIKQIRDFDEHVGCSYPFKIIKVNKMRKNIVVSRRAVL